MAPTTACRFAQALRRLGATTTIRDGCDVIASYQGVQVTAHFHPDADAFDVAWRADVAPDAATAIPSMAGVKRALGLPKQPIVTITGTGRRNSRTHIVRAGFTYFAECGVGLDGRGAEGSISDVTCPRCRSIWRQR